MISSILINYTYISEISYY